MIRYYAYYNHGGYKDFYLGNNEDIVPSRYFLPLLPVYENEETMARKVKEWKSLPPIEYLTADTIEDNYPYGARIMMSHAGYKIQLRRIEGKSVLAIRDVGGKKDTYGRSCPFVMMFVADTANEVLLRKLASFFFENMQEGEVLLSNLFVYDLDVNGLRFDVKKLNNELLRIDKEQKDIIAKNPYNLPVDFYIVPNNIRFTDAFAEQKTPEYDVAFASHVNGIGDIYTYTPVTVQSPHESYYSRSGSSCTSNDIKVCMSSDMNRILQERKQLYQEIHDLKSNLDAKIEKLKNLIDDLTITDKNN